MCTYKTKYLGWEGMIITKEERQNVFYRNLNVSGYKKLHLLKIEGE